MNLLKEHSGGGGKKWLPEGWDEEVCNVLGTVNAERSLKSEERSY